MTTKSYKEPVSVCMVYDDHGNAFDCFDYRPEELERKAKELRGESVTTVTVRPSPFIVDATTGRL